MKNIRQELLIPQEIIDYISEHFNEKLSLGELSQKCFYSPAYFSRLFKKTFNMSFTDYIMDIRLKHTMKRLLMQYLINTTNYLKNKELMLKLLKNNCFMEAGTKIPAFFI